jgi:hypothetical protein
MDRVEEIEAAISNLSPEDFRRIANWFRERDQSLWDQQLDSDSSSGRLDFLFKEIEAGTVTRVWNGTHSDYDKLMREE